MDRDIYRRACLAAYGGALAFFVTLMLMSSGL